MGNGSVCDGELTEVSSKHLRLDFNLVELLTVVDTDNRTNHLGDDDHVSQVGLDDSGLIVGASSDLGSSELLKESLVLGAEASRESSLSSRVQQRGEFLKRELDKLFKVDTSERKLLE